MEKKGTLDDAGGFFYLSECCRNAIQANLLPHANIIRENAIKIAAQSALSDSMALLNDFDGRDIYQKLGELESRIGAILSRSVLGKETGLVHCESVCEKWLDDLNARFENPQVHKGFKTGYETLDKVLYPKGIRKQSLVVVGARPKMGKTAFLNGLVKEFSLEEKQGVALFSLEMPNDQIMERMLCERANVSGNSFYGESNDFDVEISKVSSAIGEYMHSNLYMDDTPQINLSHIKKESRSLHKKLVSKGEKLGLIAVDYLTLMTAEKAERNDLAYGEITKGLKALAKELDCVVLLLTQLNRSLESRSDKRPMPSDSRDTGQIEQDIKGDEWGDTEAIVRLNRHGETGTGYLKLVNGYFMDSKPFSHQERYSDDYDY